MHKRSRVTNSWLAMLVTVTLNMVYTIVVGQPAEISPKPKPRCGDCGSQLECLGIGAKAIEKIKRLILDSSNSS